MATQDKLVANGMWAGMAALIEGDALGGQTATGSTQASALPLTADITTITSAAASTGVILRGAIGRQIILNGQGGAAITVYPPLGGKISTGATNAGYSVPVNKAAEFISADGINFVALTSA